MTIDEIKQDISIIGYLKKQGINPFKTHNGYAFYKSPFRNEKTASFKVDYNKNLWHDFGTGEGGSIIDLVMKMKQCSFIVATQILQKENHSFSFQRENSIREKATTAFSITEIKPLENPKLLQFLQSRKIDVNIAQAYCKEIHYQIDGRNYFAIGFSNDIGGYELRNPQFKGCIPPKEITTFDKKTPAIHLFEGFMDYLSLLTMQAKQADVSAVVLNSITNLEKAIPFLFKHEKINVFLDNDEGGRQALDKLQNLKLPIVDYSKKYAEYKDVNDYLCGEKFPQFQKKQTTETIIQKPKIGKRLKR